MIAVKRARSAFSPLTMMWGLPGRRFHTVSQLSPNQVLDAVGFSLIVGHRRALLVTASLKIARAGLFCSRNAALASARKTLATANKTRSMDRGNA
jgi:hypothetical protein